MKSYQPYSDGQLVRMLRQGDSLAFKTLFERYRLDAVNQAYQRTRDLGASEDIVQNIFLKIWSNRGNEIEHFGAFVRRSVTNGVLNYLESLSVRNRFFEPFGLLKMEEIEDTDFAFRMAKKDLVELVKSYAQALPEQRRKIFLLYLQERLGTDEIAERLQLKEKTVRNNLRLAVLELQQMIGPSALLLALLLSAHPFIKN